MRRSTTGRGWRLGLGWVLAATLLAGTGAHAEDDPVQRAPDQDRVVLTDGRTITGQVVGADDDYVSIRSGGVLRAYPRSRIASVERATPEPAPAAEDAQPSREAPPTPDATGGDAERKKRKRRRAGAAERATDAAPLGREAEAWLVELLNRMRSPAADDDAVRKSLAAALRALGPAALPRIRAAATQAEGEAAKALRAVADALATAGRGRTSDAPAAARDAAQRRRDLIARLGLTREQMPEVKSVLGDHLRARREIAADARASETPRAEVQERLTALRTRTTESLRALLDPTQAAELDAVADELMRVLDERPRKARKKAKEKKDSSSPGS